MEELIRTLPAPALFAVGIVIGIGLLVRYFGLMQGQRAGPEHGASSAQVAAVIVDSSALNRGTAALEALNMTLTETNAIGRETARSHKIMAEELDRIREELRIQREVSRRT